MSEITEYVRELCRGAKEASVSLRTLSGKEKNELLTAISEALVSGADRIEAANAADFSAAEENGIKKAMLDRLRFGKERIEASAAALCHVATLPDPIGEGERSVRPNGIIIERVRVPLGCVGMIYEARPNVTVDAAALCLKTGNSAVLRGGKEAINTNKETVKIIKEVLKERGIDPRAVSLIESTDRESSVALMNMRGLIDVLIPRGSAALIRSVAENATVPCIETGAGNCHIFVNRDADIDMSIKVIENAKLSRPSVCNAAESLVVHADIAEKFLVRFYDSIKDKCTLRGCPRTCEILPEIERASDEDHYTEYNDYIMSVIILDSIEDAVAHINEHSTGHSESIMTASLSDSEYFRAMVDSACVYVNASTRFTDGGEFGLGAEIGISTQKLHARGPMGLLALTSEKFLITGNGQIR